MNLKILFAAMGFFLFSDVYKIDLGNQSEDQNWSIVNDGVMGGLSKGQINYEEDFVRFSGKLSLENNGGFSWMKSGRTTLDVSEYTGVRLKVRGEGREYDFTLESQTGYSALYFKHSFETIKGEWTLVELPLEEFQQKYFGRVTGQSFDTKEIVRRVGFLMNDKNKGAFQIEVDYIEFF